jgi:ABC-type multidrug transport system ATPase subunit
MIRALGKRYRAGVAGCWAEARTLVNIDLDIVEGEVVALVGRASAGKTTLLRCAARLLVPDEGFVDFGRRADGRERVVRYFADGVQAARAARRGETWDLALIDDVDHVQGDVAAAFALVHVLTHAKGEGTALLLAARQPIVVGELSDRTIRLEHGCIIDQAGSGRPAIARVAEHGVPLTVIPGTPSIR